MKGVSTGNANASATALGEHLESWGSADPVPQHRRRLPALPPAPSLPEVRPPPHLISAIRTRRTVPQPPHCARRPSERVRQLPSPEKAVTLPARAHPALQPPPLPLLDEGDAAKSSKGHWSDLRDHSFNNELMVMDFNEDMAVGNDAELFTGLSTRWQMFLVVTFPGLSLLCLALLFSMVLLTEEVDYANANANASDATVGIQSTGAYNQTYKAYNPLEQKQEAGASVAESSVVASFGLALFALIGSLLLFKKLRRRFAHIFMPGM